MLSFYYAPGKSKTISFSALPLSFPGAAARPIFMITKCATCGKEFNTIPSKIKIGAGKYCSTKCKGLAQSKYQEGNGNPCWRGGKDNKICITCGGAFSIHKAWVKRGRGTFCSKKCTGIWRSKNLRGEKGCNWKGGINPDVIAIRTGRRYSEWRSDIFKRDYHTCQICHNPKSKPLEAHHIVRFSALLGELKKQFPLLSIKDVADNTPLLWDINNGKTLCFKCHRNLHKKRVQ